MFRRSRFSVRPNVGTVGRTAAATSQEPPAANQDASKTQKEPNESNDAPQANKSDGTPSENAPGAGDGKDQNGEGTSTSASVQRRKRFSIKPRVAPGRPPTLSRTPKSPVKAVSAAPVDDGCSEPDLEKPSTSSHTAKTPGPRGLQSPSRRRLSEDSKQHKIQPKVSPISSEKPGPSTAPPSEELPKQTHPPIDSSKQVENISTSEEKEVHSRAHDRIPPSLPDKEATEISEKAKTLIASKSAVSITRSALSLSRLLNDPSDVHRMIKSQKLRELLKQERTKEQKLKRAKLRQKEFTLDPAKMTMRDLIYYLPTTNPMMSSLEEPEAEDETVIPPLPRREEPKEREPVPEVPPVKVHSREEGDEEEEEEGEEAADAEEDQEESLMVPQVKVAEDGSLIIDEESLTVEVQRAKGPNPASDRDPIFERGSTTTYSSFRRSTYVKPWTIEETDMFFLAVSMVGTDFSMICQLFPHRGRSEIKNKFKKEERENSWRIDKAFRERRKLDIEYFSKLLEKILEFQKDKKKLKSLAEKNAKKKPKAKAKAKKSAKNLSDVEEEDEVPDLEEGQEKENEDQFNEGETPSELKKKRKRKKKVEALTEEPDEKKNKTGEVPEDSEATLPESHTNSEMCENIPNVDTVKVTGVTPAKLPRARASQPLLPLGLKRGKKGKAEKTESAEGDKNTSDEAHKEQVDKDNLDTCKTSSRNSPGDDSSSEEEAAVKHQGPTRYGRVPKPTPAFAYACKEESRSSVAETTSASHSASKPKPKCAPKRGKSLKPQPDQKAKKPKLVTLRSSNSDFSDEEDDERQDPGCSSSKDMSSIMVDGLHTINTVISEVDDPMVELDILDSMPEMLGISQDALCPDSSCHQAQHETGTAEACDHQLDLLVDVIDFFTSDQLEASQDESYNEAAQTLLTICNAGHVSQSTQGEAPTQGSTSETSAIGETSDHHNENIVPTAQQQSPPSPLSAACPQKERGVSETVAGIDPQKSEMSSGDTSDVKTGEQMRDEPRTVHDEESDSHLKSKPQGSSSSSPSTKATRRPKVKAKPNIVRASRTAPPAAETTASKEQKAEESHVVAPVETPSAVEKSRPHTTGSDGALSGDGDPEVQPTEEKSVNSLIPQGCGFSLSQSESSRNEVSRDANPTDYKDVSTAPHGAGETELRNSLKSELEGEQVVQNQGSLSDPSQDSNSNQKNTDTVAPRRSRLSKVKPNLPPMSRAALNKSQISKETVKKDSVTTLHTESQKQTIKDVETPSTSVKLTEELPAREVMEGDFGVAHQAEHQNTPEAQSTPEPQAERGSEAELSTAPEESCSPASRIEPVEDRPAEASTARELRRSRFQKVKPKPNLTQTSRAMKTKPQSTGDAAMKSPGPTSESPTKSTVEVHLQTAGSATPEHQIAASGCSVSLNPILAPDSIHVSTEEQSANEKKTLPEPVDQVDMEAASTQRATGNQNFIKAPVEQSKKQTSSDSELVSKLTDSDSISHNETSEISCNDTVTSDVSPANFDPVQDQRGQPAVSVRSEEEPAVCKPDCETATADLPRRNRSSRVKPRPNIPQTSGAAKVKPQPSENRSEKNTNPQQSEAEPEPNPACSLSSEKQFGQGSILNSGADLQRSDRPVAGTTALELQVSPMEEKVPSPQQFKRSRTQKPKPNLSQTSRAMKTKPQSTGDAAMKSPGPTSESPTKSTVEVPLQTAGSATPEHQIAASGCSLSLNPILAPHSIHVSTEEQSANEKKTLPEPVDQVDMEAASTQRATGNQNFTKAPVEQSKKQTSSDSELVSKLTDSDSISHNEASEISCNDTVTSDVSPTHFDPVQDQRGQPAVSVRPEEEPAVCKPDCETATADLPRRNRSSRVKPRPNIPQTSGAAKVKPQPSENRSEKNTNPQQSEAEPEPNPACSLSSEKQLGQASNLNSGADLQRSDRPAAGTTALELQVSPMEEKVPSPQQFKRSRTQKPKPNLSQTSRLASSKADDKCEVKPKLCVQQATAEKEKSSDKHASLTLQDAASKSTSVAPTVDSALTRFPEGTVSTIGASVQDQTKPSAALVGNLHASDQKDDKSNTGNSAAMQLVTKPQSPNSEKVKEEENVPANVEHISSSVVTEKTLPQRRQRFSKVKPKLNVEARCRVAARKLQSEDPSRPLEDQKHSLSPGRLEQKLDSAMDTTSNNDPAAPDCLSPGDCNLDVPLAVNISNTQTGAAPTAITDVPSASNASPSAHEKDSPVRGDLTPSELNDSSKSSGKAPQASRGRLIKPKPNLRCSSRLQQARAVKNTSPAETDSGSASRALSTSGDKTLVSDRGAHTQEHEKEDFEKPSIKDSSSNDANSSRCCVEQGSSNEHKTSRTEGIQRDSLLSELVPEQVPSDPDEPFFILSLTEIPVSSAGEVEARAAENLAYLPATGGSGQQSSVSEVSLEAEEDHPECSVEPKASNVTQPDKPVGDGVTDKKTRLRSRAKVSASHVSETSVAKTRNPPCRKATSKRQRGKSPSAESQMSSSETKVSTSNFTIPTQTKSATSVDVHVGLSSASTSLHSPVGDGGLVDEEPTSVSQYFLSDIFTEVEEG